MVGLERHGQFAVYQTIIVGVIVHDLLPPLVSPVRDGQGVVVFEHGLAPHAARVMKAVFLRLAQLVNEEVTGETEALFRVLWRFNKHSKGPLAYPEEITIDEVTGLLNDLMDLYKV